MENFIFEVIPPPVTWPYERVENWVKKIALFLKSISLPVLNIPEVVDETAREARKTPFVPKMDTLVFAREVERYYPSFSPIVNKITVRIPPQEFEAWVKKAVEQYAIRNFVLVGGESSKIRYPGYPVTSAAELVKRLYPSLNLGGITIFTRPKEPERIIRKMKSGITYFVSQIIFDTANMVQVLKELERLVISEKMMMPKIFVSVAPATRKRDIEFMRWLGVEFPSAVLSYILEDEEKIQERTFEIISRVLDEIELLVTRNGMTVGINFEHVMYDNVDVTLRLMKQVMGTLK